MNFWFFVGGFFSITGIIFSGYLLMVKNKNDAFNEWYALLLFLCVCLNLYNFGLFHDISEQTSLNLRNINFLIYSLLGPVLYLYLRNFFLKKRILLKDTLHFIVFFLVLLVFCSDLVSNHYNLNGGLDLNNNRILSFNDKIAVSYFEYFLIFLMFIYFSISFRNFGHYISPSNSFLPLLWIKVVNIFFFFLLSGVLTCKLLNHLGALQFSYYIFNTYLITLFIALNILVFLYDYQYQLIKKRILVFNNAKRVGGRIIMVKTNNISDNDSKTKNPKKKSNLKYRKTGLSKEVSNDYKNKILKFMINEKPFLDSEINLKSFSDRINISKHHVSQVINEHFELNFNEFVNLYRIDESKILIEKMDANKLNISEIAYKCGFNSRSTFYSSFKKHINISPSDYKSNLIPTI